VPGSLTPRHREHLVHLASWMPFGRAAEVLERMLGVQVSATTARRLTEGAGATLEALQTGASRSDPEPEESSAAAPPGEKALVVSADGAYVPLIKGEWAEVRTLAIGVVDLHPLAPDEAVQTRDWSYFSRLTDAATFADLAEVETRRRGVTRAERVAAVLDGAEWLARVHRSASGRCGAYPRFSPCRPASPERWPICGLRQGSPCLRGGSSSSATASHTKCQMEFWNTCGRWLPPTRSPRRFTNTTSIWRSAGR
jgi:hypothetical protein